MESSANGEVGSCSLAIVLLNFNGTDDTFKCLESMRAVDHESCLTIVVENGSTPDPSVQITRAHPWVKLIRREKNGGWAGGNNAGIRYALGRGAQWIMLLNNDTVVAPNLIDRLLVAARHNPDYRILGPIICFMDDPESVMTDGCRFNRPGFPGFFERISVPIHPSNPPGVVSVEIVNGCCMIISREVFERIGLIDEHFFITHEESDFCLRALQAGFRCGIVAEPLVWHKGGSWFKRTGKGLQRYYDTRNLFLLLWKHQAKHRGGRTKLSSWFQYLKYVYYRFSIEREQGEEQAADAVLFGFCDALAGRFGPQGSPRRLAVAWARWIFRIGHDLRGGRPKNQDQIDAVSVRQA